MWAFMCASMRASHEMPKVSLRADSAEAALMPARTGTVQAL